MNRQTFFFLLLLFIFLNLPRGGVDENSEINTHVLNVYRDGLIQSTKQLLDAQYFQGYGNLTGFKLSYEDSLAQRNISEWPFRDYTEIYPWSEQQKFSLLPDVVSDKVRNFWGNDPVFEDKKSYMLNLSSTVYGEFQVSSFETALKPIYMPLPSYLKEFYNGYRQARYEEDKQRSEEDPENYSPPQKLPEQTDKKGNITSYKNGNINLRFLNLDPGLDRNRLGFDSVKDAILLNVEVEITDYAKKDVNNFILFALYFQNTGSLVGTTSSAKFSGMYGMPHFAMNESNFNKSRNAISGLLAHENVEKDTTLDDVMKNVDTAESQCELVMYLQLRKTEFTQAELRFIDDELKLRQGSPLPKRLPRIDIKEALLYAPDCGIVFEKKPEVPLVGIRREMRLSQLRWAFVAMFFLTFLELNLFMRQSRASRTPSDLSNVSVICIGLLSGYDSIVALLVLSVMWDSEIYLICACNVVLNILLFYVFELRFIATIEASQHNERGISWWQILRGSRDSGGSTEQSARDLEAQTPANGVPVAEPAPVPAPQTPAQQQVPENAQGSIGPFFAFSIVFTFSMTMLILLSTTWSLHKAEVFEYCMLLFLNSFWAPQFLRNTLKNRSKSLQWEFVYGISFVRLVPLAYLCLYKANPIRHPFNPALLITVCSWIAVQIFFLYLQSTLGPRFWLNSKWLPEQYNYHPVIFITDLETGFSRDVLASVKVSPDQEASIYESDCAVCMSVLKFPVLMKEDVSKKPYEALMKDVMVTPCYHSFHTECLEDWMIYKLQCPVCRAALPPT